MNKNPNSRRSRGRGGNKRHGNVRNQTFESNGPGVKVRGTAQQVLDKYLALARDASSSGDRIMAESYFQFAEHYFRLLNTEDQRSGDRNAQNRNRGNGRDRQETPGNAEGGPDDKGSSDDQGVDDESGAEVIRTDASQSEGGDGDDNDGGNDRENEGRNRRKGGNRGDDDGRQGDNASEASANDEGKTDDQPRAQRGRRRKSPPAADQEDTQDKPVENAAAD